MNKEETYAEDKNMDEMNFVLRTYKDIIYNTLETKEIAISFFANSENFVDKFEAIKKPNLPYEDFKVLIYQDYSIEKDLLTDCNICYLLDKKFLKIITPFTRERTYDFIVAKTEDMEFILKELHIRQEKANFTSINLPIIGIDFEDLKKQSIDFLLDEDFRKFCIDHRIPLKRGIVLTGKPGTGKTLSLKWLKEQALKNKVEFYSFRSVKEFLEEKERYYSPEKKIFVFEDFDAAVEDRKKTGNTPNGILSNLLNTLEGIDEIKDVITIFTTNYIHTFDSALLRPGRIDKVMRYDLPSDKNKKAFIDAYLTDFNDVFRNTVLEILKEKNADVSYAILKGICDDMNIYNFNGKFKYDGTMPFELEDNLKKGFETIKGIINDKLSGANKDEAPKDTKSFIL